MKLIKAEINKKIMPIDKAEGKGIIQYKNIPPI